ncbi:hypothetical protein ILUMI_11376, partial [Ignelater luminosus]
MEKTTRKVLSKLWGIRQLSSSKKWIRYQKFNVNCNLFADIEFSGARAARDTKRQNLQANATKRKVSSSALKLKNYLKWCQYGMKILLKVCNESCFTLSDTGWPGVGAKQIAAVYSTFERKVRLFLTPNPNWKKSLSKEWYKNSPVGRNQISGWMANSAKKIGINTKKIRITNLSRRAAAVPNLAKQGIDKEQLIKSTGNSNVRFIPPYLQMDEEDHQNIIDHMRNKKLTLQVLFFSTTTT